jgi:YD repeat-containing protein
VSQTAHDLTLSDNPLLRLAQIAGGRHASQTTTYTWTHFDQLGGYADALGHGSTLTYDANGNQTHERDANGHTETFGYDAENRQTERSDRLNQVSSTSWDAYGQKKSETDANGRVTLYQIGAFGQISGMRMAFSAAGYASVAGSTSSSETMRQDWLGRLVQSTDSFGKHLTYSYNDADEQVRIDDRQLGADGQRSGKSALYGYDALGRRTSEQLTNASGLELRRQTNAYNNQGWLTQVTAAAGYDAGGGASLNQSLQVGYAFDANGNRVRIRAEDGSQAVYSYDANARMLQGRDDKAGNDAQDADQIVSALRYDGYGNRIAETRAGSTTTYSYDAANRLETSSAGERFTYDANGNTVEQFVRNEKNELLRTKTAYNAENRASVTESWDDKGDKTSSTNIYDAVGNVVNTRIKSETSSFDEVTKRDVRYLEQSKKIENGKAKGTAGLKGATAFTYDANGNLVYLDRGKNQKTGQRSVAEFDYDLEGQIIGRADKAGALAGASAGAELFEGYAVDPEAASYQDDWWVSTPPSVMEQLRAQYDNSSAELQSYLYANNKPVAQAQGTQSVELAKLTLTGTTPVYSEPVSDGEQGTITPVIGQALILGEGDIARDANGQVNRTATARRIAQVHYAGFTNLSAGAPRARSSAAPAPRSA